MSSEATTAASKPSLRSGLALSFVIALLGLLALEGVARWTFRTPYQWDRRLMFYSEGRNFKNLEWGGFVYQPHALIHAQTYYITELDPPTVHLEYEYDFSTNANGLVQLRDLSSSKPVVLLLGDSFTEGQGARPWFYELEHEWPPNAVHQIANGGMVGTGIQAWGSLYRELSSGLKIEKLVVIFISDDWTRPVWQFTVRAMECLKTAARCQGSEDFYGLSRNPDEAQATVTRLAKFRIDSLTKRQRGLNIFSNSLLYTRIISPATRRVEGLLQTGSLKSERSRQFEISKTVAADLVETLGRDNVLFVYLPQKTELNSGPRSYGKRANAFIAKQGFHLVDGRTKCGLTLSDYHQHDGHPNAAGNAKIGVCVRHALQDTFGPL